MHWQATGRTHWQTARRTHWRTQRGTQRAVSYTHLDVYKRQGPKDQLIGSWKDPESGEIVQSLINPQGEAYGEKAIWIMGYSDGYILQKEPRLYVLTDWQFRPVAEVEADSLGVYVKEINKGRQVYQPFLSKETFSSTKQGEAAWTQEVLNNQGEAILPPLENSVTWPIEEKWLLRAEGGGTQTPRLVLYLSLIHI